MDEPLEVWEPPPERRAPRMREPKKETKEEKLRIVYPRACPHCAKSFPSSTRYHKHVNYHTAAKTFECDHPGCRKAYKRKVDLEDHKAVHLKVKPFRCTVESCYRSFTTKQSLMSHIGRMHNGLTCTACGLRFRKKAKLQQHWAIVHGADGGKVEPGTCPDCGKTFRHRESLEKHILAKHPRNGIAPKRKCYKCTGCEEVFSSFLDLVHHRREKHPKLFKCDECDFVAKKRDQLKHHKDLVHRQVMVPCQHKGCPQTFTTKPAMRIHYRVAHLNLKEYLCRHCGQVFAYKRVLQSHCEKVHKIVPTEEELKPCRDEQEGAKHGVEPKAVKAAAQPELRPAIAQAELC